MTLTIVSGGQTGSDRGGMDAAIRLGLDYGGWATADYKAEDGAIPAIYASKMKACSSREYNLRTRLNVQDSDATLIVSYAETLTGGSDFTARECRRQRKPCRHLVLPRGRGQVTPELRSTLLDWLANNHVAVLNVAGPRESKEPGVQAATCAVLIWILDGVAVEELGNLTEQLALIAGAIDSDAPTAVALECEHRSAYECQECRRTLCWECEALQPRDREIKTAVRWCRAPKCEIAEAHERGGLLREAVALDYQWPQGDPVATYCGRCCQDIVASEKYPNICICPEGPLV